MAYSARFHYNAYMKKIWILFLALCLLSCTAQPSEKETIRYQAPDFTAAVISDLHYTSSPSVFNSVVPLEPVVPEVTDALIEHVIAEKPDAFIMTGDNTGSGEEKDVKELSQKLQKLREAGIEVIITTGNHDYSQGDISVKAWERYIMPMLNINEQEPDSHSYMTENNHVMAEETVGNSKIKRITCSLSFPSQYPERENLTDVQQLSDPERRSCGIT